MVGFLRFVFIFFLVLFLLGFVARILLQLFLRRIAKKMESHQRNQEQQTGDTFVKNTNERDKIIGKETGEYVDYEEIKE